MIIQYTRNFKVGRSTHSVSVYKQYNENLGLIDFVENRESTQIRECLKGLSLPSAQLQVVKELARDREDGIVLEDGTYKRF